MKITLLWLELSNFKGTRNLKINFTNNTNVFGDNKTGKTTLFDSFLWLLFGKDSSDRKDFEIKTLDENNQPYRKLVHFVEGGFTIDGAEVVLRRELREKWTKKRGSTTEEFTGHETSYFWNEVPLKQEEFTKKIGDFINESTFKLITNTTYFNSMKWQERRAVLVGLSGTVDNISILLSLKEKISEAHMELLTDAIKQGKANDSFKAYRAEISAKRNKVKNELDLMPSRIEEAVLAIPQPVDFESIASSIESLKSDIQNVEGLLSNKSQSHKEHQDMVIGWINQRNGKKQEQANIEFEVKNKVRQEGLGREQIIINKRGELNSKVSEKNQLLVEYKSEDDQIKLAQHKQASLRDKWTAENEKSLVINENEFSCPTCKRAFDGEVISQKKEELTKNFNKNKADLLQALTKEGEKLGAEIELLETSKANIKHKGDLVNAEIALIENEISTLKEANERLSASENESVIKQIAENKQWLDLDTEIYALNQKIEAPFAAEDNSDLLNRKQSLTEQLQELSNKMVLKDIIKERTARVDELRENETKMATEVATYEGIEFSIAAFIKASMLAVEAKVNERFSLVKFKLFEEQINGGEVEACVTLINGVPYSDANTASKIQAGLDIINTLTKHYGVQAPVWIDNRESVVTIPDTDCQVINLIVSESDKKLRVV